MEIDEQTRAQLCEIARNTAKEAAHDVLTAYTVAAYLPRGKMARWLGVSAGTLDKFTVMGLKCHTVDGMRLWRKAEAIQWLDQFQN